MFGAVLARVAVSDLVALVGAAAVLYGLSLLHPAAPWIGGGVACGVVSVELAKRESAARRQE